ncbi:MAG: hypothetical protein Q3M24_14930 [Candidatus Electrothrix aestuarii]|uniref:Uncharacterized protein n=1 Tax=Candidatus Electrothrix aestuarii TaxID=3062594 RepID=A0AAU8LRW1_9BACT
MLKGKFYNFLYNKKFISTEIFRAMLNNETSTAGLADSKFINIFSSKIWAIERNVKEKMLENLNND